MSLSIVVHLAREPEEISKTACGKVRSGERELSPNRTPGQQRVLLCRACTEATANQRVPRV